MLQLWSEKFGWERKLITMAEIDQWLTKKKTEIDISEKINLNQSMHKEGNKAVVRKIFEISLGFR